MATQEWNLPVHRQPLLTALERYFSNHQEEGATCARFLDFVRTVPSCFERNTWHPGHVTGSAWLVDPAARAVLLTHHKKLGRWLQLGGHCDGQSDVLAVALREAEEESGLTVAELSADIFDIDIHQIPARGSDPAHLHFDVRYLLRAQSRNYCVSDESNDLAWVPFDELANITVDGSVARMAKKWQQGGWSHIADQRPSR